MESANCRHDAYISSLLRAPSNKGLLPEGALGGVQAIVPINQPPETHNSISRKASETQLRGAQGRGISGFMSIAWPAEVGGGDFGRAAITCTLCSILYYSRVITTAAGLPRESMFTHARLCVQSALCEVRNAGSCSPALLRAMRMDQPCRVLFCALTG